MPRDWESRFRDFLRSRVPEQYWGRIDEFMGFISELVARLNNEGGGVRYARSLNVLLRDFDGGVGDRAKLNAFYAFLVFKGYASAYAMLRSGFVAGGESIYTWLRLYRDLMSGVGQP